MIGNNNKITNTADLKHELVQFPNQTIQKNTDCKKQEMQ